MQPERAGDVLESLVQAQFNDIDASMVAIEAGNRVR